MRRIGIMGLCLVAVLVMSALAAGSVFAASPEYKVCFKVKSGGEFSDKGCTTPMAGGKYKLVEYNGGKKHSFKNKAIKPINRLFNPLPGAEKDVAGFTAKQAKGSGEMTGPKTATFTEEFKGVKTLEGKNCETKPLGKGKVKTQLLESTLVKLSGGKVGQVIKAAAGPMALIAEYECEGTGVVKVHGAIIAEIEGASGAASKTYKFKVRARGGEPDRLQEFLYLPGELSGPEGAGSPAAEEDTAIDYFQFAVEFKACVAEGVAETSKGGDEEAPATAKTTCEFGPGEPGEKFIIAEGYAPPGKAPTTLLSETGLGTLPGIQEGTTEVKGEVLKIV